MTVCARFFLGESVMYCGAKIELYQNNRLKYQKLQEAVIKFAREINDMENPPDDLFCGFAKITVERVKELDEEKAKIESLSNEEAAREYAKIQKIWEIQLATVSAFVCEFAEARNLDYRISEENFSVLPGGTDSFAIYLIKKSNVSLNAPSYFWNRGLAYIPKRSEKKIVIPRNLEDFDELKKKLEELADSL